MLHDGIFEFVLQIFAVSSCENKMLSMPRVNLYLQAIHGDSPNILISIYVNTEHNCTHNSAQTNTAVGTGFRAVSNESVSAVSHGNS